MVVYNRDKKRTWKEMEERVEGREEEVTIVGGDCNARTERRGRADKRGTRKRKEQEIKRQDNKYGRKNAAKVAE